MQGPLKLTYLGIDNFNGKKDPSKTFYNVSLLQGSEIIKIFLESGQEVLFNNLQKFDEVVCVCSWSLGTDKYGAKINYRLLYMEELEIDIPFENKLVVDADKKPPTSSPVPIEQKTKTA